MSLNMTRAEREAFLADLHVGIISIAHDGHAPLTVPIWYSYEPGGTVNVLTSPASLKGRLLDQAKQFSLCAQTETAPYKYATVEGLVTARDPATDDERRSMAHRYLGKELGDLYIASTADENADNVVYRMTPERWYTVDYTKL
jgi:nitroimidazol reductase NimA-like FMN-containing flavoprotein (pyridoxamine 5'-phosphate oxidase superfamily)